MSSAYSIGSMNQLGDSLENSGFTPDDVTKLRKFGNLNGIKDVLDGKAEIAYPGRTWREQDGVIYLSVTSDGTTGPQWIERLEKKGFRVGDYAKSVLRSQDFKPTNGVAAKIAILKGELFADDDRITKKIRAEAGKRKFSAPNAEAACLIRENFSDEKIKAMGLVWIVTMHEPIKDSGGDPVLLDADRRDGGSWLGAGCDRPGGGWGRGGGFAFVVSQVELKS